LNRLHSNCVMAMKPKSVQAQSFM